ncbi:MATE efflux family protein [Clostridiales bacterium 1_7_47FAA]|uniref:Multidrug export protein MepA n=1 Tax=Enterocloster hominis (ex Hitch et al. 2024) TaxID=1917870 RepID=A0ABV1DFP5_9FIRM|nr:MATE family efflux transporter [Lachnoclostridium pacaense]EEQ59757.1 MATE efflux family protein [Clostridiales bacterium 1_7_47FAA]MCC2818736.1 MATE family efflux transporter [Lachnoclostridium pacaense]MCD8170678.1 MATE family efflux transporter [Clostridiales bacterium]
MTESTIIHKENPLGTEPVGKLLLAFSVPSIIACLVNSVYNIVDQIFIGQGVGYLGNAATTVSFPMMTIVMAFATLAGSGGGAYAAIKLGEKDVREADLTLNNLFSMSLIIGILISALGLLFLDPLLRMFGATETVMPYARDYTSIILMGVPFSVLGITMSNMARTDGNPRLSMYGILIGATLNTILDPLYIFVFHWGVKGAAIATITSQILSAGILCHYFWRRGNMRFQFRLMKLVPRVCVKSLTLGASSGIAQLVACVMQVVMNNSLVYYGNQSDVTGDVALSAMGIVMKIVMILGSVCIGIGVGSQPILGFNYGAGKYKRIRDTYFKAIIYATVSISVGWLVCQTMPHLILRLFGSGNAQFTRFAVKCMRIYLGGLFCAGFQIVSTNYFQATGQPLKASLLSMLRQLIILIPLLLILPLFFGLDGILYAGPVADIGSAVIVACFIIPSMKKLNQKIRESQGHESI